MAKAMPPHDPGPARSLARTLLLTLTLAALYAPGAARGAACPDQAAAGEAPRDPTHWTIPASDPPVDRPPVQSGLPPGTGAASRATRGPALAFAALLLIGLMLGWRLRCAHRAAPSAAAQPAPEPALSTALEAQRGTLRAVADTALDGVFLTDDRGQIVYTNPAAEHLLGYPPGALIGRDAHATLAPPELQERCRRGLEGFARDGRGEVVGKTVTQTALRYDGSRVAIELSVLPLWLDQSWHAIALMRDHTERAAMARDLDETRQNFHSLIQDNRTGILILDALGSIRFANRAAETLLDAALGGLIGQPFGIPVTQDPGDISQTEIRIVRHDGSAGVAAMGVTETRWQGQSAFLVMLHDVTERKVEETRIQRLAFEDRLTGLANRDLFFDRLAHALTLAIREHKGLAVLFMDLDHFKEINDTLGHEMGDAVLRAVAERLQALPRTSDTVARWGGDEFTAVFYDVADQRGAERVGRRLLDSFLLPFNPQGRELYVTPSIGISLFQGGTLDADELVRRADAAMYEAKRQGGNAFRVFDLDTAQVAESRLQIERDLRKALLHSELVLHYQPQVALDSGRCVGFEALLRWERPGCGRVGPADFLPLLESTGLIVEVGRWVIDQACRQLREWSDTRTEPFTLAVNLSPIQSAQGDLFALVASALDLYRVPPWRLVLEIAEGALFAYTNRAPTLLQRFADLGVALHVDDFGTGYSSLPALRRLPIAAIKIDERFVRDLVGDAGNAALVRAILTLAHGNGKQVIAEGVETAAAATALRGMGCDLAQGYFFGRPMAAQELPRWLARHADRAAGRPGGDDHDAWPDAPAARSGILAAAPTDATPSNPDQPPSPTPECPAP